MLEVWSILHTARRLHVGGVVCPAHCLQATCTCWRCGLSCTLPAGCMYMLEVWSVLHTARRLHVHVGGVVCPAHCLQAACTCWRCGLSCTLPAGCMYMLEVWSILHTARRLHVHVGGYMYMLEVWLVFVLHLRCRNTPVEKHRILAPCSHGNKCFIISGGI